jgi:peroxiredoxin
MNRWYSEYRPQGVAMLALTTDPFELADRTAQELDMRYPIATDLSGETTVAYGANAVPMVFVIDQKGVIRDVMVGLRKKRIAELEKLVEHLLDKG